MTNDPALIDSHAAEDEAALRPLPRAIQKLDARAVRIFVKGVNWVGDAIIATPALAHLRRSFPQAQITVMVRPWVASVYEHNPDIDTLWVHDDAASNTAFIRAVNMVRRGRFQLGVALPNSVRSGLLLRLGGVPHRFGYRAGLRNALINHQIVPDEDILKVHQVYFYLRIVESFCGSASGKVRLTLQPGELEREEIARLLAQEGIDRGRPRIGLAPGSINSNAKRWDAEQFAAVAERLVKADADVILLGSAREQEVLDRVATACKAPIHNLGSRMNLSQVIAFIARLDGMICNDSGAMHMAAALDVPTVAVFGPTDWSTTYPFSTAAMVVRGDGIDCAPCMLRECPIDHRCMSAVTVDMVLAALKKVIQQRRDGLKK